MGGDEVRPAGLPTAAHPGCHSALGSHPGLPRTCSGRASRGLPLPCLTLRPLCSRKESWRDLRHVEASETAIPCRRMPLLDYPSLGRIWIDVEPMVADRSTFLASCRVNHGESKTGHSSLLRGYLAQKWNRTCPSGHARVDPIGSLKMGGQFQAGFVGIDDRMDPLRFQNQWIGALHYRDERGNHELRCREYTVQVVEQQCHADLRSQGASPVAALLHGQT